MLASTVKYIPSWMPGAGFKKTAEAYKETTQQLISKPYNMVKERMVRFPCLDSSHSPITQDAGTAPFSFTSMLIEEGELNDERVLEIKWCSVGMYLGNSSRATFEMAIANVETELGGADTV
jgi:hypothetical protein